MEATEANDAEAYSREKEATTSHRLSVSRQIELLRQAASTRVPPLGYITDSAVRTSLPPHPQGHVPTSSLGVFMTSNLLAGATATRSTTLVNAAP